MNLDTVKELLNLHLKNHPEYENWMQFDSIEKVGHSLVPRYKSPEAVGASMSELKAREIYGQVCSDIIKVQ